MREIAAGLTSARAAVVAGVSAPFAVVGPDGTVALRLRTPDEDPGSARSARCIAAATAALGGGPTR